MSDDENFHVFDLVNQITTILAGEEIAVQCSALTLASACLIIATEEHGNRVEQAREFAKQLEYHMRSDDFVNWIKQTTRRATVAPHKH
jgi:hypothetical protein